MTSDPFAQYYVNQPEQDDPFSKYAVKSSTPDKNIKKTSRREEVSQNLDNDLVDVLKGAGRGLFGNVEKAFEKDAPISGSLPSLWDYLTSDEPQTESEPTEVSEWIRSLSPDAPETPAGKGTERFTRLASDPMNIALAVFNPAAGITFPLAGAIGGQAAEEMGFGETGQTIGEITGMGVRGAKDLYRAAKSLPALGREAKQFYQSLSKSGKAQLAAGELTAAAMNPSEYHAFKNELMPAYRDNMKTALEKQLATDTALQEQKYMQEVQKIEQANVGDAERYQRELKSIANEHEIEMARIQKDNAEAMQSYNEQMEAYDAFVQRQDAVDRAIKTGASEGRSLEGRVTQGGQELPFKPAPISNSPESRALGQFSPLKVDDPYAAGRMMSNAVKASSEVEYRNVNALYNASRQSNAAVESVHPEFVGFLQDTIANLRAEAGEGGALLTPPKQKLLNYAESMLGELAEVDEGVVTGYRPISNQLLIDRGQNLRYFMDYEFAHANPKGIYSPMLRQLDTTIEGAARTMGNEQAFNDYQRAKHAYSEWSQVYNNDYVNPMRSGTNRDYLKNFDKVTSSVDEFLQVEPALMQTNTGTQIARAARRELVDKAVGKYFQNPNKYSTSEFMEATRKIRSVMTDQEAKNLRNDYLTAKRTQGRTATKVEAPTAPNAPKAKATKETVKLPNQPEKKPIPERKALEQSSEAKLLEQKLKRTPEELMKQMDSPSSLEAFREEVKGLKGGDQLWEMAKAHKTRNILYKGSVSKDMTGKQFKEALTNGKNYSLMAEMHGEQEAQAMLDFADQVGKESILSKASKETAKKLIGVKILGVIGLL